MANVLSYGASSFALLVLFFVSSVWFNRIHGLGNQQRISSTELAVINHENCQSCPGKASTLKDVHTYSLLKYDIRASLPSSFTICVSVLVTTDNFDPPLFNLLGNDGQSWFSAMILQLGKKWYGRHFYYPTLNQYAKTNTMRMFPNQWVRSCIALNTVSGLVQWVARGELMDNRTFPEITNNVPTDLSGKVILGSCYFTTDAVWVQSSNKLTKLEIFSSALAVEKMTEFTTGMGCGYDGDYLGWDEMEWNFHGGAKIEHLEAKETCTVQPFDYYAASRDWRSCMQFCQNLGGSRAPAVNSLQQWERLRSFAREKILSGFWLPIHDEQNEGTWRDFYSQRVLNFTLPWLENEPNGGTSQNCAFAVNSVWRDMYCKEHIACVCQRQPSFHMRLRGLCANSAVDKYYQPMNDYSDFAKWKLVGFTNSAVVYDEKNKIWKLSVTGSNVFGNAFAAHNTYLLGKQRWDIDNDINCNIEGEESEGIRLLKLTGCNTTGQFTCDDGQCVTMDQRCNQHPDCRDRSDETNCKILVLVRGYNKNVPPVPVDDKSNGTVKVSVSLDILKLVDIDEEDYSIEIQFSINLKWVEDRATYQNLKERQSLNAFTQENIEKLWLPKVIYENTDQKESTRLGTQWEWETSVEVERNTIGTQAGLETVDETELFEGKENRLVMFQTYTHDFQCIFDLKKYPFDTQTCSIDMAMGSQDWTSVSLIPDQLNMKQKLEMAIFIIKDWRFEEEAHRDGTRTLKMTMGFSSSDIMEMEIESTV